MDSNQGYNPYKWVICPLTRVIKLHITSYLPYPEPLSRLPERASRGVLFVWGWGFNCRKAERFVQGTHCTTVQNHISVDFAQVELTTDLGEILRVG